MEFATGALGTLLPKLAQVLRDEYNLKRGARKDIQFLHSELEIMHAALHEVGKEPREQLDKVQRIWARDVRALSYDMEDIIDTFMVCIDSSVDHPSKSSFTKSINKMIEKVKKMMARREIGQDIKDIRQRVREVADRRDRYKVEVVTPAKTFVDPRIRALYTEVSELVGIGKAKEEVIRLTKGNDDQQRRIVSIAGFGGLGKTTLANAVYKEIKGRFDCTAFVTVSRNPDAKNILEHMLFALGGNSYPNNDKENLNEIMHLINLVHEALKNKRYLVVIDDIWDTEPWDNVISCALIENNKGSRIITTTRIIGVAEHVGGCYKLNPLSDESSKILFYGRIFGSIDKCPDELSEVSMKILKKCGGVPLAIITTSSLLAKKSMNTKEWYDVCDLIGSGLEGNNPTIDDMMKILLLSYYDLPSHLKMCLLYLSIFPEDYEIAKNRLIRRQRDQSFLEIGENYFNELLNRSLIQPASMDKQDGSTPQACRVHDIVHDLIVSLSKEECFISTVLGDDRKQKDTPFGQSMVRMLSLQNNNITLWPTMMTNMQKLRSLTIFKPADAVIDDLMPSLLGYHLLRVLDLQGSKLVHLECLGFLGMLSHLRYLGLSSNTCVGADQLPEEIGKLRFLQILDLSETMVEQLPPSIIGLRQLMCLCCAGDGFAKRTRLPDGLKNLTSLEVIKSGFVNSKCIAEELGHLIQLRVLDIRISFPQSDYATCAEALLKSLAKLKKLESIRIICPGSVNLDGSMEEPLKLHRLEIRYGATVVASWIKAATLPLLSYLHIVVMNERREDIQVFGRLPNLRYLYFRVVSGRMDGKEMMWRYVVEPDAFPSLLGCQLELRGVLPTLFPRGAMPKLQDFRFWIHPMMYHLGSGDLALDHLPSLQTVSVGLSHHGSSDAVRSRVKETLEHEAAVHPNNPRIEFFDVNL